jgi:predicted nucleotide-binding protein (sugar kinase/HSP70/actin superfamily)
MKEEDFLDPFVDLNHPKKAIAALTESLARFGISSSEIKVAFEEGMHAFKAYRDDVKAKGLEIISEARKQGKTIIVVAGRPYHIDPEVNHGIDKLLDSLDVAVVSEDAIAFMDAPLKTQVLNQWTYHARLFDAAHYVASQPDMEMLHLVSFGCGVDAITTDEVRRILEEKDRLYTMIKIDEINNLGAVRIRIRSLLAAVEEKRRRAKQ